MLEYIAINNYKLEDMKPEKIEKLEKQDIKTKLLPTLKDRNPKKNNVDDMKKSVREYLKDILKIDDNIKEFYNKFQKGIFEPELLFDDNEIIEKIKEHQMIIWKLNNKYEYVIMNDKNETWNDFEKTLNITPEEEEEIRLEMEKMKS